MTKSNEAKEREQIFTFIRPVVALVNDKSFTKHFISCDWQRSCRKAGWFKIHLCPRKKLTWIRRQTCPTAPGLLLRRRSSSLPATPSCRGTPGSLSESQKKQLYTSTTSTQFEHHRAGLRATGCTARYYLQDFVGLQSQRVENLGIEKILQGRVPPVDVVTEKRERGWTRVWIQLIEESDEQQLAVLQLCTVCGWNCKPERGQTVLIFSFLIYKLTGARWRRRLPRLRPRGTLTVTIKGCWNRDCNDPCDLIPTGTQSK